MSVSDGVGRVGGGGRTCVSVGGGHVEDGVAVVVARVVDGGGWEAGEEGLDVGEVAVATAEEEVVDVVRGGYQWWWHDGGGDGDGKLIATPVTMPFQLNLGAIPAMRSTIIASFLVALSGQS